MNFFYVAAIAAFLIITESYAQTDAKFDMNQVDYQHESPPSFKSKLIQSTMGLFGIGKRVEKKMITDGFDKEPASPPKSLGKNFLVEESLQEGRKIWEISSKESPSEIVILYLHGGAYMANLTKQHWALIEELAKRTDSRIVVPDYPLAPDAAVESTYEFVGTLYARLVQAHPTKRFIFMGDSAGGGLALGFAMNLRNEGKIQATALILFSPWLDISMSNPDIQPLEKKDKLLTVKGLKSAGQKYAGAIDAQDFRVSPIYGDLAGLPKISVFTGTNDILNADARKLKQQMINQGLGFNFFEYPSMFHDWIIITDLPESLDALSKVAAIIDSHK